MINPGDLVMLADEKWVVPGALTALKYFQRLQADTLCRLTVIQPNLTY